MMRCSWWFSKHITLRNLFTSACALISAFLIYQELYRYLIVKPTTTAKEEKEIRLSDIPETLICREPGFNITVLQKYGYFTYDTYYRGSMDGTHFVGWNGLKNESKSANSILEEALTVNTDFLSLFTAINFSKDNEKEITQAEIKNRTLTFPIGRCLVINPPSASQTNTKFNNLRISINKTAAESENIESLRIYFMDRANSVKIFPSEMEMVGDVSLKIKDGKTESISIKTKISKFVHVEGDPLLDCVEYTENKTFSKCAQKELLRDFRDKLGCDPPLPYLNADLPNMFNRAQ